MFEDKELKTINAKIKYKEGNKEKVEYLRVIIKKSKEEKNYIKYKELKEEHGKSFELPPLSTKGARSRGFLRTTSFS